MALRDRAWRSGPVVAWVVLLVATILAPLARPGYLLRADMVSTPQQYLVPDAWGVGDSVPRAVPLDAVVALATTVLDGGVVVRLILVIALLLAGLGAARLVPGGRLVSAAAATLTIWNPYVAERLLMGNWALLLAFGALPWAVAAALDLRQGLPASGWRLTGWLALTCLTPPGAVLGLLTVLPVVAWPGDRSWVRRSALATVIVVGLNLPWIIPSILHPSSGRSDEVGVGIFAAKADTSLGLVGSLLGVGGIWNEDAVPASRASPASAVFTVVLLALAVLGLPRVRDAWGRGALGLVAAAAAGLGVALWGATAPESLAWLVETLPGPGLLRDGHRFLAPLALLLGCTAPVGLAVVGRRVLPGQPGALVGVGALLIPLAVMPDLAWGGLGRVSPVAFPADWYEVRDVLSGEEDNSDVVSLPWWSFRRFPWNADRSVLDPLPRFVDRVAVTASDLAVGTDDGVVVVPGENRRSERVGSLVESGRPLTETLPSEGIGWAVLAKDTSGAVPSSALIGATLVVDGENLALYRLADADQLPTGSSPRAGAAVVAGVDVAVLGLVVGALVSGWLQRRESCYSSGINMKGESR